jgi:UPF0755 protein
MIRRALVLVATFAVASCGSDTGSGPGSVRVTIPRGASLAAVADTLVADSAIRSPVWFRTLARLRGKVHAIRAGTFDLPKGTSAWHALTVVTAGTEALERLVVVEGLTLNETAQTIRDQLGIPIDSLLAAAHDPGLATQMGSAIPSLEGYLYPSTYYVPAHATARQIVRQMTTEFLAHWQPGWDARARDLGLTRHQVVTLASIIEAEVRYPDDRAFVSSVYHNRLNRHMRLQADPTVIYALGKRRRLWEKDYLTPSRYNTYLIDGLPPGPIGEPAEPSIEAALFPVPTAFLYFVARGDGKHVFSRTLDEHEATIRRIRTHTN